MSIEITIEVNGSDQLTLPDGALRMHDLRMIVQNIAREKAVPLSEVSLRFVDKFAALLDSHFPAEDLAESHDPDFASLEADSGCRTCASGQPCQTRIETDIEDILLETGLTDKEKYACLEWLIQTGCSSLTQSIDQMAEEFTLHLAKASPLSRTTSTNLASTAKPPTSMVAQG